MLTNSKAFSFRAYEMDLMSSLVFEKEQFLEGVIAASGMTPEEFVVDHILEEYPSEVINIGDVDAANYSIQVTLKYRIRLKTPEEKQLEIESAENTRTENPVQQGENNDDSY